MSMTHAYVENLTMELYRFLSGWHVQQPPWPQGQPNYVLFKQVLVIVVLWLRTGCGYFEKRIWTGYMKADESSRFTGEEAR